MEAGNCCTVNMAASSGTPEVLVVENPDKDSSPMLVNRRSKVDWPPTETALAVLALDTGASLTRLSPPVVDTKSSGCGSVKAMQRLLVTDSSSGSDGTHTNLA